MSSVSLRILKQVPFALRKCRQRTLHERYGLSFNIGEMALVRWWVSGLPHLGSSDSEVLLSTKRLPHFFSGEVAGASVSETDLSSAAIVEARRPLSVSMKKRMTARCSINIRNVQTRINVDKTSAGADVVGAAKIFDREVGEEDMVYRIESFTMNSAHNWVK
jgi:hypothetical protein